MFKNILFLISLLVYQSSSFALNDQTRNFDFEFSTDNKGWQGDFADYNVGQEVFFELNWGWTTLPSAPLQLNRHTYTKGLFLSGNNHSDDLFMFVRKQIAGLKPDAYYTLIFNVVIESNVPAGQFGVGGSPGESIYFKIGASTEKPTKIAKNHFYELNANKGNQSQSGENARVVGDLANPAVDPSNPKFQPKIFANENHPILVKTNNKGQFWVFIGTDSAFEGLTLYYIAHISVEVKESNNFPLKKSA